MESECAIGVFAQGEREAEGEEARDENEGMRLMNDWLPAHPENEEREKFLEVLRKERPLVKMVSSWD